MCGCQLPPGATTFPFLSMWTWMSSSTDTMTPRHVASIFQGPWKILRLVAFKYFECLIKVLCLHFHSSDCHHGVKWKIKTKCYKKWNMCFCGNLWKKARSVITSFLEYRSYDFNIGNLYDLLIPYLIFEYFYFFIFLPFFVVLTLFVMSIFLITYQSGCWLADTTCCM